MHKWFEVVMVDPYHKPGPQFRVWGLGSLPQARARAVCGAYEFEVNPIMLIAGFWVRSIDF